MSSLLVKLTGKSLILPTGTRLTGTTDSVTRSSSAAPQMCHLVKLLVLKAEALLFVLKLKNRGPSIQPWGTPTLGVLVFAVPHPLWFPSSDTTSHSTSSSNNGRIQFFASALTINSFYP